MNKTHEVKLSPHDVYIAKGKVELYLKKGKITVMGMEFEGAGSLNIPKGRRVPVEAIEESVISVKIGPGGEMEKSPQRTIPELWDKLADEMTVKKPSVIIILGEMDTGKTFFTTYIANKLCGSGCRVGIIDGDTGQSDIGPPGTIGLAVLDEPILFLSQQTPDELYFTGAHSPGLHFLPSLVGLKKLTEKALTRCDTVLIDTPGWVQGDGGRALRRSEIEILMPDVIILMQRHEELEHLVRSYYQDRIIRITVSKKASPTSPAERKGLRELLSMKYFKNSMEHILDFKDFETDRVYFKTGKPIELCVENLWAERLSGWEGVLVVTEKPIREENSRKIKEELKVFKIHNIVAGEERGVMVGLLDKDLRVMGLGIIDHIDWKNRKLRLITPAKEIDGVSVIQFGSLKLTPQGREAGFLAPGYL